MRDLSREEYIKEKIAESYRKRDNANADKKEQDRLDFEKNNPRLPGLEEDQPGGEWTGRGFQLHESVRLNNIKHIQRIRREMAERREAREAENEME